MKYTIKEVRYSTIRREWLYDVEANSEKEALTKISDGKVESIDYEEEEEDDLESISEFRIQSRRTN